MNRVRSILATTFVCVAALALTGVPALAGLEQTASFDGDRLTVRNLIGEVRVEPGGSRFEVSVTARGKDARDGMITMDRNGDELNVRFPGEVRSYVYPGLGRGSDTSLTIDRDSSLSDLLRGSSGKGRLRVRSSGDGTELWADVIVRVPDGARLEVEHGIGTLVAENVDGDLDLSTRSGDVKVDGTGGRLNVATGSGDVDVARARGEKMAFATGSGDVVLEELDSEDVQIATGSGDVTLTALRAQEVQVATGSGDVRAGEMGTDELSIGTGSGEVTVELDRMGDGKFSVGTGSGDISLVMPPGASAEVHAETDQGGIEVAIAGAEFQLREDDEVELTVGGGSARVSLGTGSGDIEIRE